MNVAILGLGEAGSVIAADLVKANITVNAWDPAPKYVPPGVKITQDNFEAIKNADIILSLNLASVAIAVACSALPALTKGQVYADFNTASPKIKHEIAQTISSSGALFVDVALLAPVPARGLRTPTLVSGPGAQQFYNFLTPYGMPITILNDQAGSAAAHKLIRSIFMKGLAAVVIECLAGAKQLGCEAWAREQILTVISDEALIDRFVEGSRTHAARRVYEMEAAMELLAEIGVASYMTKATTQCLADLSKQNS